MRFFIGYDKQLTETKGHTFTHYVSIGDVILTACVLWFLAFGFPLLALVLS